MCLAVPGKVVEIFERDGTRMAHVDFGGVRKEACLEYVPDMRLGDYAIVHVGFALQRLDEATALETLRLFRELGELDMEFGDHWGRAAEDAGLPRPAGTGIAAAGTGTEPAGARAESTGARTEPAGTATEGSRP
jgi:hydrogenase expression/formation protein HypC